MGEQVSGFPSRLNWSISWAEESGLKASLGREARFILRSDSRWATIGNANLHFHFLKCFEGFLCWLWTIVPRTAEFSRGCSSAGACGPSWQRVVRQASPRLLGLRRPARRYLSRFSPAICPEWTDLSLRSAYVGSQGLKQRS